MRQLLNLAFIFLVLVFGAIATFAQEVNADFIKKEVVATVENDLKEQGFLDVDVKVLAVPFSTLNIPDGQFRLEIVKNQGSENYSKKCIKPLRIYVNNRLIRAFGVPLEIKAYKMALVASKNIEMGKSINTQNVSMQKVEANGYLNNLIDANCLDNDIIATKYYRAGQHIDKRFVKMRSDVQKNEMVTVQFKSSETMLVTVQATAMASANIGDMVAAVNKDNKKVYYGKVIAKNLIKVNI